jgi:hypothetical protein
MYFTDIDKHSKAKLNKALLWEYDTTDIDYEAMKNIIVQRVAERGRMEDWYFILNLYGLAKVKEILKSIAYMNNKDLRFVSHQFSIPLKEMKCYGKKQLANQHWNS